MSRNAWAGPAVLAGLLLAVGRLPAGDWRQFRGPGGTGVSDEKNLPVRWSGTEGLRWKVELPGRGLSGPVIVGGRVFLTACSGYRQTRLHVLCFDAASGAKQWERQLTATGSTMCHPKTSMAAPTPVSDGTAVYALFATGDLAAFDRAGNLLWYRALQRDYPGVGNQVGMAASPVLAGDTLLLPLENAGDSFAAGLDKRTGRTRWRVSRPRDINWTTPLVLDTAHGTTAVFQTAQDVTALDPATGKVRWTWKGANPSSVVGPLAGGDGQVLISGSALVALRPGANGAEPRVAWRSSKVRASYPLPVVAGGRVYGLSGVGITCLDAATGAEVWRQRVRGPFSASPVVGAGKLYAVNEAGTTSVVALDGRPRVLAVNPVDETVLASPALAGGVLYLRSDRHLYCIGAK